MAELNLDQLRPSSHTLTIDGVAHVLPGRFPVEITQAIVAWFEQVDSLNEGDNEKAYDRIVALQTQGEAILDDLLRLGDPALNGDRISHPWGLNSDELMMVFGMVLSGRDGLDVREAMLSALVDAQAVAEGESRAGVAGPPIRPTAKRAVPRSRSAKRSRSR